MTKSFDPAIFFCSASAYATGSRPSSRPQISVVGTCSDGSFSSTRYSSTPPAMTRFIEAPASGFSSASIVHSGIGASGPCTARRILMASSRLLATSGTESGHIIPLASSSTSRSTCSGYFIAYSIPTHPPIELPTRKTGSATI